MSVSLVNKIWATSQISVKNFFDISISFKKMISVDLYYQLFVQGRQKTFDTSNLKKTIPKLIGIEPFIASSQTQKVAI